MHKKQLLLAALLISSQAALPVNKSTLVLATTAAAAAGVTFKDQITDKLQEAKALYLKWEQSLANNEENKQLRADLDQALARIAALETPIKTPKTIDMISDALANREDANTESSDQTEA